MEEKNENIPVNPKIKLKTSEKAENFWYYYKWHTIIGIFALVVVIIIAFQLFTKTSYDVNIVYAGGKSISTTSLSGDGVTELSLLTKSIESVADDYNSDGKVRFNLQTLRILSENEISEATKDSKDASQKAILENETKTNRKTLGDLMLSGYYLYFLSEDIFREYDGKDSSDSLFANLADYIESDEGFEYASERGIYISSLPLYSSSDFSILPEDTVICLRIPGVFDGTGDQSAYKAAEDLLRALLSYGK